MVKAERWPKHGKLALLAEENDIIITSYTDGRGYIPTSCGVDSKNKIVYIIVKNK
jgi:hypothetical protein